MNHRILKFGVLGAGRGKSLADGAHANGIEIAALCDRDELLLRATGKELGNDCKLYLRYEDMLQDSSLDAIIVANYATEHVPAVKLALAAGKHVMSECMACFTLAEAVELVEAVEQSGKVYYFAENYPFFAANMEMKRLYETGAYGDFRYGEGEYVHPISNREMIDLTNSETHWRNWISPLYYCTHSIGPIMHITNTRPVAVNGFLMPYDFNDPLMTNSLRVNDTGGVLICRMDNDAIVKIIPWSGFRDHGTRYRICCNRGTLEYNQGDSRLRIHTESVDFPNAPYLNQWYDPLFPAELKAAVSHGHSGGDFITSYYFAKAIRTGEEPNMNVYRAIDMTIVGILGYQSALDQSNTRTVPDFRDKKIRDLYRNDHWSNDPAKRQPGMPLSSIKGQIIPAENAYNLFKAERTRIENSRKN